jgi:hypothetical protein
LLFNLIHIRNHPVEGIRHPCRRREVIKHKRNRV